jgi:hypothetical protein
MPLANDQGVEANNLYKSQTDVGLGSIGLLIHPRVPSQVAIEFFAATVESIDCVLVHELFDA